MTTDEYTTDLVSSLQVDCQTEGYELDKDIFPRGELNLVRLEIAMDRAEGIASELNIELSIQDAIAELHTRLRAESEGE